MEFVTCDGCTNVSEAGWGDTPFCLDCHLNGTATEGTACARHGQTYYTTQCNVGYAFSEDCKPIEAPPSCNNPGPNCTEHRGACD